MDVYANGYKNTDRLYVKIVDPNVKISLENLKADKIVRLTNNSNDEEFTAE